MMQSGAIPGPDEGCMRAALVMLKVAPKIKNYPSITKDHTTSHLSLIKSQPHCMNLIRIAIIAGLILTFIVSLAVYPVLPDTVVSHWNASGVPDGSMGKLAGIGLVPVIMVALVALLMFLPRIDPLRKNYAAFRTWYDGFILVFVVFMLAVQCQIILWSLGHHISMNLVMPVLVGLLFLYIGFFLERVEPNWFAGIRTPWTLSSATVWKKTHMLGGKLFKIAGIVSCAGAAFPDFALLFILVPALGTALVTVVYSWYAFQKEKENS